ncbi:MAG: TspO/MBR family protein [Pseudomonadota bacterium]
MSDFIAPLLIVGATLAAASTGSTFRPGSWYAALDKPSWTPPNWAFPLVWSILYAAMAFATWLVWQESGLAAWPVFALYGAHLIANGVWSYLFFGRRRLDWAMAEVVLLWLMIAALALTYFQHSQLAGILFAPYLIWVSIAAMLNLKLLQLNGPNGETTKLA